VLTNKPMWIKASNSKSVKVKDGYLLTINTQKGKNYQLTAL